MEDRCFEPDIQPIPSPCCDCTESWGEDYFYTDSWGWIRRGVNSCLDDCALLAEWWNTNDPNHEVRG